MHIAEMFKKKRPVFSVEVFPPKREAPVEIIYKTLDELRDLRPDFISVTYGAGGSEADSATLDIAALIKHRYNIEPLMHLTCLYHSREEVAAILGAMKEQGVDNIMALRGDIMPDIEPKQDFRYASELTAFIRENGDFGVSGACYPEGHLECDSLVQDVLNVKKKVEAGCSHLVSQLFFDNDLFYAFRERLAIAGVDAPLEAGVMPVTNVKQIQRMVTMCGASLPPKFTKMMQRYEYYPQALKDAGVAYAVNQIVDLVAQGAEGIHIYTMNDPLVAKRIKEAAGSLFDIFSQ